MYFANWRNGDDVQHLPWIIEEWQKAFANGDTIDDFIGNLGFTRWGFSRSPADEYEVITGVFVHVGPQLFHIGAALHCRFLILWQDTDDKFGLFFAATPFDMFAIVREIHDYGKHMAQTIEYRYSGK